MNRYRLIAKMMLLVFTTVSLTACTQQKEESTTETDSSENETTVNNEISYDYNGPIFSDGYPIYGYRWRYENAKEQYPDKTILVWACDENIRFEEELNQYLDEHGYPYVIVFRKITPDDLESDENGFPGFSYAEKLQEVLEDGEQIDIISTCYKYAGNDTFSNPYHYFVDEGILQPIDQMLQGTEIGSKYYEAYPEHYWDSLTYHGQIYGIDGYLTGLHDTVGVEFRTDLADSFYEQLAGQSYTDLLSGFYENAEQNATEDSREVMIPGYLSDFAMYTDYDFIWEAVYIDENGQAANIYESEDAVELFDTLCKGAEEGYVVNQTGKGDVLTADMSRTRCGDYVQNLTTVSAAFGLDAGIDGSVEGYRVYPSTTKTVHASTIATGISSDSENAEMAFSALMNCLCDEEINNILCFGTDYEITDNCITPKGYYSTLIIENRFAHNPFYGLFYQDVRSEYRKAYEECELSPYIDFSFDGSAVEEQLYAIQLLTINVQAEFPTGSVEDNAVYLDQLNQRLYEAGMQDVLDEANRQLEEYREKNQ